jgi:hypothetical protein
MKTSRFLAMDLPFADRSGCVASSGIYAKGQSADQQKDSMNAQLGGKQTGSPTRGTALRNLHSSRQGTAGPGPGCRPGAVAVRR